MKRHESLAPLSREHHAALLLAQLLKKNAATYKGMPAEPVSKAAYAVNLFHASIQQHFSKEEIMFEKVKHTNAAIEKVVEEIYAEHTVLRNKFLLLSTAIDKETALDELGNMLEAHIRKEERVLFPLLQKYCSEELLSLL